MYIAYKIEDTRIRFWKYGSPVSFKTEGAAKAALTREAKKMSKKSWRDDDDFVPQPLINREDYAIAEAGEFYDRIEKKELVKNIMSGKEYYEGVNVPAYMSPAHETYWCR